MEDYILKHSGSEIDAAVDKIKNLDNVGSGTNGKDGVDGREVELQTNSTHIQWRYSGESEWRNLIELKRLEGPSGEKGETGQNAVNPNFSIGTVTTLDAGSQATVSLTGTYPNLKLNFGIPRGADGVSGGGTEEVPTVEKSMWYGRLKLSEVGGSLIQYSSITADMIKNSSNLIKKSPSTLGKTSLGLESSTETGDYIVVVVPPEYTVKKDNGFGDKVIFNEDDAGANGINITIDGNEYKLFGEILLAPAEIFIYID